MTEKDYCEYLKKVMKLNDLSERYKIRKNKMTFLEACLKVQPGLIIANKEKNFNFVVLTKNRIKALNKDYSIIDEEDMNDEGWEIEGD
ncbi:MAG: hypothetical protein NC222_06890 [Staphylococcus sp.]|nr:hypothetical protein [Staphylococcus sp.]